jgi:hypothetical protein
MATGDIHGLGLERLRPPDGYGGVTPGKDGGTLPATGPGRWLGLVSRGEVRVSTPGSRDLAVSDERPVPELHE